MQFKNSTFQTFPMLRSGGATRSRGPERPEAGRGIGGVAKNRPRRAPCPVARGSPFVSPALVLSGPFSWVWPAKKCEQFIFENPRICFSVPENGLTSKETVLSYWLRCPNKRTP